VRWNEMWDHFVLLHFLILLTVICAFWIQMIDS
jgi:hypothetical protein